MPQTKCKWVKVVESYVVQRDVLFSLKRATGPKGELLYKETKNLLHLSKKGLI